MFPLFQWPASELAKLSACTAKCMNKIYIIYINKTVVKCCVDVPEYPYKYVSHSASELSSSLAVVVWSWWPVFFSVPT